MLWLLRGGLCLSRLPDPQLFLSGVIVHRNSIAGACVACSRLGCSGSYALSPPLNVSQKSALTKCRISGWLRKLTRERQPACLVYLSAQVAKDVGCGAAEAVDRLFEVADEEQAAGFEAGAADFFDEVDLESVGVLKFVDEEQPQVVGEALLQVDLFGTVEQGVGLGQQVVEIEFALVRVCGRRRRRRFLR